MRSSNRLLVWEQQADQWDLDEKPTSEKSEGKAEMSEQAGKPTTSDTVENAETTKADWPASSIPWVFTDELPSMHSKPTKVEREREKD